MAADAGLGLSPTRDGLRSAMPRLGMAIESNFDTLLDALEYIKLARSDSATESMQSRSFTFAHRRFQEYFATSVVLREPSRVNARQLLTDMHWRETAVVICQTRLEGALAPILEEIRQFLAQFSSNIPGLIDDPLEYVVKPHQDENNDQQPIAESFPWLPGLFHLLQLL